MITIVSGGQTGVDRAALDSAINLDMPHGGWCPKGRLAEDGVITYKYKLKETNTSEYSQRTKLNIRDSDGTLVIFPENLNRITDGTILTVQELKEKNKPHILISLSEGFDIDKILSWVNEKNIKILNIAGPRESQCPGIYSVAFNFMNNFLSVLKKENHRCDNANSTNISYSSDDLVPYYAPIKSKFKNNDEMQLLSTKEVKPAHKRNYKHGLSVFEEMALKISEKANKEIEDKDVCCIPCNIF